jgi:hypothetical protein
MAVIQISKIQHRRGAIGEQGMPQLASGELGWAVDTQQLFIGNGSVAEGAPAVGNTEVLTQYSTATINLFKFIYEYQGDKPEGYFQPQTVERTLQQKLDDIVSVKDFGAKGDGITDDHDAIQTAISATYINSHDPNWSDLTYRKILHFPAGTYNMLGTVYVPPNVYLQGEGPGRSVLRSINTSGRNFVFVTRSVNPATGDFLRPVTADGGIVDNVVIDSLGFTYGANVPMYTTSVNSTALINLDQTTNTVIKNCEFSGGYTTEFLNTGSISNLGENPVKHAGIQITGVKTKNITIDSNNFSNLIVGTFSYQDNRFVNYTDNQFNNLYTGIVVGSGAGGTTNRHGPLHHRASRNIFQKINREGIAVNSPAQSTTSSSFLSESNVFDNVGNGKTGNESNQVYECINFFNARGCRSVNDTFTRFSLAQTTYSTSTFKPLVTGQAIVIDDKTAYRYAVNYSTVTTTSTIIRIPYLNTLTTVSMEYQLQKSNGFRKGIFTVNAPPTGQGSVTYKDDYNYSGTDPKVVLTAKLINSTNTNITSSYDCIAIQYENDARVGAVGTGTISLTVKYQT